MEKPYFELASEMMDAHADDLSNRGCNDWKWPKNWSAGLKREFARAFIRHNERREPDMAEVEAQVKDGLPDFAVARVLSEMLLDLACYDA